MRHFRLKLQQNNSGQPRVAQQQALSHNANVDDYVLKTVISMGSVIDLTKYYSCILTDRFNDHLKYSVCRHVDSTSLRKLGRKC